MANIKVEKISFNLPAHLSEMLTQLTLRIGLHSKVRVSKTSVYAELLELLKEAKIDPRKVKSVTDITAQLVEYIKKKK